MAIVVDLNGSPPGRTGNQTGIDPHNMSKAEYQSQNDGFRTDASVTLTSGAQLILGADGTRSVVSISNPAGNSDIAVGVRALTTVKSLGAMPVFGGTTHTVRGPLARKAFYCFSPDAQALTILVG